MQDAVKNRIARWARQATASQLGNPGVQIWLDPESDSVVGYRRVGNGAVTVGDPIGPVSILPDVIRRFEAMFDRVAWFGASDCFPCGSRLFVPLGFETVLTVSQWRHIIEKAPGLRYQVRRSCRKAVRVVSVDHRFDLTACLTSWRSMKSPWRLYFMTDPDIVADRANRRTWAAVQQDQVVGYLVASPVPGQSRWLFEQWVRHPNAPNGVIEQLIDFAINALPDDAELTMGLCPFSASPVLPESQLSMLWMAACRVMVRPFYRCTSLTRFKLKFQFPIHRRARLVFSRRRAIPLCLVDVILAFIIKP